MPGVDRVVGKSPIAEEIRNQVRLYASDEGGVLITGESGAGKDLVAQAIHEESGRRGPFILFNAAAVQDNMIESELFGHVRGAFTGADRDHRGLFEQAHRGSLFLNEIGDITPAMQVKLLTALETKRIHPVGAEREVEVDVRVIAATNKDLAVALGRGVFRKDLYYRLATFTIYCPPLSKRLDDIPLLLDHFGQPRPLRLTNDALQALQKHTWPGNVRELRDVVNRLRKLPSNAEDAVGPAEVAKALVPLPPDASSDADRSTDDTGRPAKVAGASVPGFRQGVSIRVITERITAALASEGNVGDDRVREVTRAVVEEEVGKKVRFRDVPREMGRLLENHPDQVASLEELPSRVMDLLVAADEGRLRRAIERAKPPTRPGEKRPVSAAESSVPGTPRESFTVWAWRIRNPTLWMALSCTAAGVVACILALRQPGSEWVHYAFHATVVALLLATVPVLKNFAKVRQLEEIQVACLAARDLRGWWKWALAGWVLLYVTLASAQFMNLMPVSATPNIDQRICAVVLNLLQNLTTMFLLLCYEVTSRRTILENRDRSEGVQGWVLTLLVLAMLETATLASGDLWTFQELFRWGSGFAQGGALALLVGRLDSRYIQLPRPVIAALYLYAAIQGAWPAIGPDQRELALVLTTGALALKCLLAVVIAWLLERAVMLLYLSFMRALDQRIEDLRTEFLEALFAGDSEALRRIFAEARGDVLPRRDG